MRFLLWLLALSVFILCRSLERDENFYFNNGYEIPKIGMDTFGLSGSASAPKLSRAYCIGYRHLNFDEDTITYGLIKACSQDLIKKYKVPRDEIFLSSQINQSLMKLDTFKFIKDSVKRLDIDYYDLLVIEWPGFVKQNSAKNKMWRRKTWRDMVKASKAKLIHSLGVSHYNVQHLKELFNNSKIRPAVNEIEWHPFYHDDEVKRFCDKHNILIGALHPLGGKHKRKVLSHSTIVKIAKRLRKSESQIVLRWILQQGIYLKVAGIEENNLNKYIDLDFNLSKEDMKAISKISERAQHDKSSDLFH